MFSLTTLNINYSLKTCAYNVHNNKSFSCFQCLLEEIKLVVWSKSSSRFNNSTVNVAKLATSVFLDLSTILFRMSCRSALLSFEVFHVRTGQNIDKGRPTKLIATVDKHSRRHWKNRTPLDKDERFDMRCKK